MKLITALCILACFLFVAWRPAEATSGSCSAALEKARAYNERLDMELRLRTGELRVVRGQLASCDRKSATE